MLEKEFYYLYHSPEYYDNVFRCKTYHNDIMTYLVLFMKENKEYMKYGDIRKVHYFDAGDGNIQIDFSKCEDLINNFEEYEKNAFGSFYFKDHISYLYVSMLAKDFMLTEEYKKVSKENNKFVKGKENEIKHRIIEKEYNIAMDEKENIKIRQEALKTLGTWYKLDLAEQTVNANVTWAGLERLFKEELK